MFGESGGKKREFVDIARRIMSINKLRSETAMFRLTLKEFKKKATVASRSIKIYKTNYTIKKQVYLHGPVFL